MLERWNMFMEKAKIVKMQMPYFAMIIRKLSKHVQKLILLNHHKRQ